MRNVSYGLIFLIFWLLLVSAGLYIYLFYLQPTKLASSISYLIKEKTKLEFNIGRVELSFAPTPTINIHSIKFFDTSLNTEISISRLEGVLSWRSILQLKPIINRLACSDAAIHLTLPRTEKKEPALAIDEISQNFSNALFDRLQAFSIPHYFSSMQVTVANANGEIINPDASVKYVFKNLNISARTPDIIDGNMNISLDHFTIYHNDYLLLDFGNSKIHAGDISYSPRSYSGNLAIETNLHVSSLQRFYAKPISKAYDYFPMPEPSFLRLTTDFNILIKQKTMELSGTFYNKTVLPMNGYDTPIELTVPFRLISTPKKTKAASLNFPYNDNDTYGKAFLQENTLSDYALDLAGFYVNEITIDNAVIKADTDSLKFSGAVTGLYPFNPLIFGKAHADNFSLPRWIGPTREMSAGLYNALDKIKADMDVYCTLKGVFSPNITAKVLNYAIKGKSVTANFLKPDICFDLTIPEQNGSPINLNPLFPEINGKNSQKVQLPPPAVIISKKDKNKSSFAVSYHININVPSQARIWKIDCSKTNVLIAPDKNNTPTIKVKTDGLYAGKATALATLNSSRKHSITAQAENILIEAPLRNIMGYTPCTGRADADLTILLQGSNLAAILNSLEIKGTANLKEGALHSKKEMLTPFKTLAADIDIKTVPFKADKSMPKTFALNGSWKLEGDFPEYGAKLFSKNSSIDFSVNTGQPLMRSPQATDILLIEKKDGATVLKGSAKLGFQSNSNKLIIENYKGMLRNSKLIADIVFEQKEKATFNGTLYFQHFNLSDYVKTDPDKEHTKDKDLPLDFICSHDIDLAIKADKLTFYDITTRDFTGNIKIKDNKISVNNLKTKTNKGFIQALLEGSVKKEKRKYQMQTLFKLKGDTIDMLSITKMRKQKTLMSGIGNIAIQGNALISKNSDIFKTMNAEWNMQFINGYFQSEKAHNAMLEEQSETPEPPSNANNVPQYTGKTSFSNLSASGTITNGVARTNNLVLQGTGLFIHGGGQIDLVSEKIDAFAKATYLGIPEIPVIITGTITKPEYEVKVLNAVSHTIGNIGTGIVDIFSSVLTAPFKLFMQ